MNLPSDSPETTGLRILVIEDNAEVRLGLQALLFMLGHHPVLALDMQSGLRLSEDTSFDVVLTDIGLPDGDGWELLRRLKLAGNCPPLALAMSCLSSPADAEQSEAAGYSAHLHKPFTVAELERALAPYSTALQVPKE